MRLGLRLSSPLGLRLATPREHAEECKPSLLTRAKWGCGERQGLGWSPGNTPRDLTLSLGSHCVEGEETGSGSSQRGRMVVVQDPRSLQKDKWESTSEQGLGLGHRMPATARSHRTLTVNESEGPQEHDSGQPEGAREQRGWRIRGISSQRGRRRRTVLHASDIPFSQEPRERSHY